jgi:hypothetical protein
MNAEFYKCMGKDLWAQEQANVNQLLVQAVEKSQDTGWWVCEAGVIAMYVGMHGTPLCLIK